MDLKVRVESLAAERGWDDMALFALFYSFLEVKNMEDDFMGFLHGCADREDDLIEPPDDDPTGEVRVGVYLEDEIPMLNPNDPTLGK